MSSTQPDSLRVWLETPDQVPAGEPVPIVLRVENITDRSLDLYLRGRSITFDLVVSQADKEIVWRRLENEMIPAILRIEVLSPGQTLELMDSWDQRTNAGLPVGPNAYTIRGEVLTETDPLVTPPRLVRIS